MFPPHPRERCGPVQEDMGPWFFTASFKAPLRQHFTALAAEP